METDSQASAVRAPIQDEELGEVELEKGVEAPSSAVVGEPDISIVTRVRGPEPGERWAGGVFFAKHTDTHIHTRIYMAVIYV